MTKFLLLLHARSHLARFSRLRHSIRYGCWPLVPNFPMKLTHLRRSIRCACEFGRAKRKPRARAALANPMIILQTAVCKTSCRSSFHLGFTSLQQLIYHEVMNSAVGVLHLEIKQWHPSPPEIAQDTSATLNEVCKLSTSLRQARH